MMRPKLEICCFSLASALNAQKAGADRIELCDNLFEGGTTPSFAMIEMVREKLHIEVNVMVRPRGGDFLYSEEEFEIMKRDIIQLKKMNIDGVVIGLLEADGQLDVERTKLLTDLARPMSVTFHRAIDMSKDPVETLKLLMNIGVDRVLTSGARQIAEEGVDLIANMVEQAGEKIKIMAGSGVNKENIKKIYQYTGAHEFHFSAKTLVEGKMKYKKTDINMGGISGIPEYDHYLADKNKIKELRQILNEL